MESEKWEQLSEGCRNAFVPWMQTQTTSGTQCVYFKMIFMGMLNRQKPDLWFLCTDWCGLWAQQTVRADTGLQCWCPVQHTLTLQYQWPVTEPTCPWVFCTFWLAFQQLLNIKVCNFWSSIFLLWFHHWLNLWRLHCLYCTYIQLYILQLLCTENKLCSCCSSLTFNLIFRLSLYVKLFFCTSA